jgi:hypothetical protein
MWGVLRQRLFFVSGGLMGATKNISLILPFNLYKLLKLRSQRLDIPATQIVRDALENYLKKPREVSSK